MCVSPLGYRFRNRLKNKNVARCKVARKGGQQRWPGKLARKGGPPSNVCHLVSLRESRFFERPAHVWFWINTGLRAWKVNSLIFLFSSGSRTLDQGSRIKDPGSHPGAWILDAGFRLLDPGSMIKDPDPLCRIQDPGSRVQDPESGIILDAGSWSQGPGSWI